MFDYNKTEGQHYKYLAERTKWKVYNKKDIEAALNNIIDVKLNFKHKYGAFKGKSKEELINLAWKLFNTVEGYEKYDVALELADYIIKNAIVEDMYEDSSLTEAKYVLNVLKPYLKRLDLESIKSDISYKYDKSSNAVFNRWHNKDNNGLKVDTIVEELREKGIIIESENISDIFFEIEDMYSLAKNEISNQINESIEDILNNEDISVLRESIAEDIMTTFKVIGKDTIYANKLESIKKSLTNKFTKRIDYLKERINYIKEQTKLTNKVLGTVQNLTEWKNQTYLNFTFFFTLNT